MTSEERSILFEMVRGMMALTRAVGGKADTGDSAKDEATNKLLNETIESLNKTVVLMEKIWGDK